MNYQLLKGALVGQMAVVADGAAQGRKHGYDQRETEEQLVPVGRRLAVAENEGGEHQPQPHAGQRPTGPGVGGRTQADEAEEHYQQPGNDTVGSSGRVAVVQHERRQDHP